MITNKTINSIEKYIYCTLLLLASALPACGDSDAQRAALLDKLNAAQEKDRAPVAVVNGHPIPSGAFAALVARSDGTRSKQQLLDETIAAELRYAEAVQSGYADGPEAELSRRRLMVQALLRDRVERAVPPESIPEAELRAFFDKNAHGYRTPELRAVDHLLVQFDPDKYDVRANPDAPPQALRQQAHAFAEQLRADLIQRDFSSINVVELQRLANAWKDRTPPGLALKVESEIITPLRDFGTPGQANFFPAVVLPFADATFATPPGVPSPPVDTIFGTHLLVVTHTIPAQNTPFEEVAPAIRDHLLAERRREAFNVLLAGLMHDANVQLDPEAPDRLEASASHKP